VFGSFEDEYRAVRTDAAVFDLSYFTTLEVRGDGATDVVQRACARDVGYLLPEKCMTSVLLNDDGEVVDVALVRRAGEGFLLGCSFARGDRTREHLAGLTIGDAEITVSDDVAFSVEGPYAWKYLGEVVDQLLAGLPFQGVAKAAWAGDDLWVTRNGMTGEYGYELQVPATRAAELWERLTAVVRPAGYRTLELAQLETRYPVPHREAGPGVSVRACGYNWLVDPDKTECVGAGAVADLLAETGGVRPVGFTAPAGSPVVPGLPILVGRQLEIGTVLWADDSPGLEAVVGVGRVDAGWAAAGLRLQAGSDVEITTQAAPYVVPRSWTTPLG